MLRKKLMKYSLICLLLTLLCSSVQATEDVIPDFTNPVVGLIGASSIDPEASPQNAVGLTALNGASFRGLADFLKARSIHSPKGIVYREAAEGGATTNGQNGFLSVVGQAKRLVEHTTMWTNGTHMKAAVIMGFNDCMHSLAGLCDESQVLNNTVANVKEAVQYLQSFGVKVFVARLIDYDSLNLPLLEQTFSQIIPGFQVASESEYNMYKSLYESEMEQMPDVTVIDVWRGMKHIGDGLHADHESKMRASIRLHDALSCHFVAQYANRLTRKC